MAANAGLVVPSAHSASTPDLTIPPWTMGFTPPSAWASRLQAITSGKTESALSAEAYSGAGFSMLQWLQSPGSERQPHQAAAELLESLVERTEECFSCRHASTAT
jgi:hypothetical protein